VGVGLNGGDHFASAAMAGVADLKPHIWSCCAGKRIAQPMM
jgi:hypothetical protein